MTTVEKKLSENNEQPLGFDEERFECPGCGAQVPCALYPKSWEAYCDNCDRDFSGLT